MDDSNKTTAKKSARQTKANRQAKFRRVFWRIVGVIAVGGLVGAIVMASLPKPLEVDTATATRGELQVTVNEDGRTRVKDRYAVSVPLAGTLARIELEPGEQVEEGTILSRILPLPTPLMDAQSRAQAQASLSAADAAYRQSRSGETRARTALDYAQTQLETETRLVNQGGRPRQQLERAQLEVQQAEEALASARFGARVAQHQVGVARAASGRLSGRSADDDEVIELTAPVQGVVLEVFHGQAGVVQPGTQLLEIGDPSALEIVVDVLTTVAVRIEPGAHASVERWGQDTPLDAVVRRVEPKAFTRLSSLGVEEQRVNVVLDLLTEREVWSSLGDGFRVEARIVLSEADDVLRVPTSALFRHDDAWSVFTVVNGIAHQVALELSERNDEFAGVVSGLDEDAVVILHPSESVVDGSEVVRR